MDPHSVYPPCPDPSHAQEPLSRICLEAACTSRAPVCCICEFESHQGHNTLPVKRVLSQISESAPEGSAIEGASRLAALRKQYFDTLTRCRREVLEELNRLQTKAELYFNRCEESLVGFYSLGQPLPAAVQADPKLYKRYFTKLLTLFSSDDKKVFSLTDKIDALLQNYRQQQKLICENLDKIEAEFKKSVSSLEGLLVNPTEAVARLYSMRWSQTFKGTKIKIADCIAEQTGMESSGQRFALMEESLPTTGKSQWGIKVKKFVGWVGVGMCLKNSIKTANYHFNYTNIGHGSYLISTNGYTWSHSVKEFNSAFKTFQFTVNDTVFIEYDPIALKLRFRKNQGPEKFELDIVPPPAGDLYHPCVNLCSTGDCVELVYPGASLA